MKRFPQITSIFLQLYLSPFLFLFLDKAGYFVFGPQCRPKARGVCGCNRQSICTTEHCHHWHCQHHSERWQGAGPQGFGYGLHSDRRYYQCEDMASQTTCQPLLSSRCSSFTQKHSVWSVVLFHFVGL